MSIAGAAKRLVPVVPLSVGGGKNIDNGEVGAKVYESY
jgi:hypothetical protein